jgi:hypothetical protein
MSSKRFFAGRQCLGRQFEPSLMRGVGTAVVLNPKTPSGGTLSRIGVRGSIARTGLRGTLKETSAA